MAYQVFGVMSAEKEFDKDLDSGDSDDDEDDFDDASGEDDEW